MIIGVPRERKTLEKRVAITPDGVAELVAHGHTVLIEQGAGLGSFFEDSLYSTVGAHIVPTLQEVWGRADMIVKVKEPHESELPLFRPGLILFDYLHLASLPEVARYLVDARVTSFAYELIKSSTGRLPLLEPMSEVAGKLAVMNGQNYLLSQHGGRGILLGGTSETVPAHVVIVGAGVAGFAAADVAIGCGADVTVLDINPNRLERLRDRYGHDIRALTSSSGALAREISTADLLIGAVLVPGAAAPKIISRAMMRGMKKGGVFVDISIDQGGCSETSRPTSLDAPTYLEEGIVHYGVCNMPAQTPRTSTLALTTATLPYIIRLADRGVKECLAGDREFIGALNTFEGRLTNKEVSEAVGIPFSPA